MRFFRRHPQTVFIALLALAMQWSAAYGHFHSTRGPNAELALACRTMFKPSADRPCPGDTRHDKDCAICCSMALASAAVIPMPPALDLPSNRIAAERPQTRTAHVDSVATASFEPRGPPRFAQA